MKNEYRPDAEGNLTSKFITSTYNEMNQLVKSIDSEGEEKYYYYDTWGNLISDGIAHYYYDHLNRLKEYRPFGVVDGTHYTYYIDNLRKSKDDTYFIWLDGNMVYEFTSSDSDTYTYGHRLLYSDEAKYVLNAHGDVVALLNNSGVVTKRYEYDAFGNELDIDNTDTNPFRYCAEYFDIESGQIYLRNRYYQPVTGKFTQLDPIRDGLNWYAYCYNNPINFIDPIGHSSIAAGVIIGEKVIEGLIAVLIVAGSALVGWIVGTEIEEATDSKKDTDDGTGTSPDNPKDDDYENAKKNGKTAPKHKNVKHNNSDDNSSLPTKEEPNSSTDLYDSDGNLKQRRYYGPDGRAQKDIDYKHSNGDNTHTFPHEHTWDWSKNPPRSGH